MDDDRKHRLRLGLAVLLFVAGAGSLLASRGEGDLRSAARVVAKWDGRRASLRAPKPEEIAALPDEPRELFRGWQNKEGGDTMGVINQYAEQAGWLRELADERAFRREVGTGLVAAALLGTAISVWLTRMERRRAAAFE